MVYRTHRLRAHAMRACSQVGSQTMLLIAFSLMPLAGVTAIMFSSPIFSTLASAYFLHERVGAARWVVLLIGFLGVLVIANPGADSFQIGALFALGNAVLFGTVVAGVRGMASTESAETLIMFQLTLLTTVYAFALLLGFTLPTAFDALVMIGSGIGNGVAQYLWTRAIHLAPTSAVVPFQYLQLVWAMLLGFAVWGDLPTIGLLVGSAIVISSGLYLFWHETRRVPVADAD
jgi:drug/metabolite transporter (DMT)-like permease